jgi:hypothetical protein
MRFCVAEAARRPVRYNFGRPGAIFLARLMRTTCVVHNHHNCVAYAYYYYAIQTGTFRVIYFNFGKRRTRKFIFEKVQSAVRLVSFRTQ